MPIASIHSVSAHTHIPAHTHIHTHAIIVNALVSLIIEIKNGSKGPGMTLTPKILNTPNVPLSSLNTVSCDLWMKKNLAYFHKLGFYCP